MQGKAALHDLVHSPDVQEIIAADFNVETLTSHVDGRGYGDKVQCRFFDAGKMDTLNDLLLEKPDVVIDLLPVKFRDEIATAAVEHGISLVNTVYTSAKLKEMHSRAESKEMIILPEFGLDPGIDLVLLGQAIREYDSIELVNSYGAGIPELEAADNPLKYKVTWTFEGVLRSYIRESCLIQDGETVIVKGTDLFDPSNVSEIEIEGIGKLEVYPNGDALEYVEMLGKKGAGIKHMGRYTMRYPGHSSFWKKLVDLHFLDDEPVEIDGISVDRRRFLATILEPHIQLGSDERDISIVRLEVQGQKNGRRKRVVYQVIDRRDLQTGFTAMNRTVGFTASIGAQLIGKGIIPKRGLLSPVNDIPYRIFVEELGKRGINVMAEEIDLEDS